MAEGHQFPSGVSFTYVPYTDEKSDITACGIPQKYDASKEWADKKVVLFGVPGAFTPGCSASHLPGYLKHYNEIKGKNVDIIAVVAYNDAWVMNAWAKANGVKNDNILFLSDDDSKFAGSLGLAMAGPGSRVARFAMIIDHGKITYCEKEPGKEVSVSSAEAVLGKL